MLVIDGTYERLRQTGVSGIFYMEITEGRNDSFEIYAMLAGGAVMHISSPEKPETFDTDFPNASEVDAFTIT